METYLQDKGKSLFDLMTVPSGIDKDVLVDNIIMQGGEFEVIYAEPLFFRQAIYTWSMKHERTFQKWIDVLNMEYNPIENYDRMEEWNDAETENKTGSETTSTENNSEISNTSVVTNATEGSTTDTTGSTGSTENTVSAYDAGTYQPSDKSETANDISQEGTSSENSTTNSSSSTTGNETTSGSRNTTDNIGRNSLRTGRAHGNIGVTTSQQMLQAELDVQRFNIYDQITDLFLTEFCILVYE